MYYARDFQMILEQDECNIILGNSRSLLAIDANSLECYYHCPTLHLGYSSADMLTQLTIFRYVLYHVDRVETLILEISPFHFDNRRVSTHDIVHLLIRRNPLLILHSQLLRKEFIQNLLPSSETLRRIKNSFGNWPYYDYSEKNRCSDSEFDTHVSKEDLRQVFDDDKIQYALNAQKQFVELLEISRENDTEVIIVLSPTSDSFRSGLSNYDEYKRVLIKLLKTFPEVTVIDADRVENQKYLGDPDHIACPEKFTREVIIPRLAD